MRHIIACYYFVYARISEFKNLVIVIHVTFETTLLLIKFSQKRISHHHHDIGECTKSIGFALLLVA